jgi:hypothetical protein
MMRWRILWLIGVTLAPTAVHAQPCCGPVTPEGHRLAQFLDGSGVEHLWVAGWHVDWQTGEKDRAAPGGREAKTHCSAFVAAMAQRVGVYVLRPPDHRQNLLANAQMRWLREHGADAGWRRLGSYSEAQQAANRGELVLEAFENPDPHRPGHIAIVRPSEKTRAALDRDGPQETQAGERNWLSVTTAAGFRHHKGAWKRDGAGGLQYYAHTASWP